MTKTVGDSTHNYVLDGTRILSEAVTGSTPYTLYYLYDASGNVRGFIYNNRHYFYKISKKKQTKL
ncbi:MAG: hypothetical protein IKK70_06645 [Clostridia bacterium]|nr:hypothetical protein [Clostridia bacterium]